MSWRRRDPKIIYIDKLDKMPKRFQEKLLNFMESGHIKVDQMRKQYDFKIRGAKIFGACNEITRLSRPLQSRFRRLYLPSIYRRAVSRSIDESIAEVEDCSCY